MQKRRLLPSRLNAVHEQEERPVKLPAQGRHRFSWLCPSGPAATRAALNQAQQGPSCAQGAAREETSEHIRTSTTAAKGPCFIEPTCFQANN